MKRARGFTLIELMVAVALGLLTTLVIAQVFLQSEGNKRTTTSGSDAQVTGALALYALQRDIQMAGYGLSAMPAAVGCPTTAQNNGTTVLSSAPLVPVHIAFGASGASDTLTVLYSQGSDYSVPLKVSVDHARTDVSFTVPSTWGVSTGDMLVAVSASWPAGGNDCTLFQATSSASDSTTQIQIANTSNWNKALSFIMPTTGYPAGSALLNLGSAPVRRVYSVNPLTWTLRGQELGAGDARDMFPQIVLLKALYGKAAVAEGPVVRYDTVAPLDSAEWRLVKGIRLLIVARSAQREKEDVTSSLVWDVGPLAAVTGSETCKGSSKCVTLDVSPSDSANWKKYRYKVFETVVPMRNVVWNQ
ncbi:PilW family protein [Aquabacterium sp.]|uniref:PilW family protein n=1 Tax=Aquabacterium sp. TaxID=1872578 RepID=UPI0024875FB6|nr:PilW family protein [Aquabacterium sp.]MDI1260064.1 PilW family protein [Aquabacterium sp.]